MSSGCSLVKICQITLNKRRASQRTLGRYRGHRGHWLRLSLVLTQGCRYHLGMLQPIDGDFWGYLVIGFATLPYMTYFWYYFRVTQN